MLLNRIAKHSYTHAPETECSSVRHAHEQQRAPQQKRAHSARYAECANVVWFDLDERGHCLPVGGKDANSRFLILTHETA
jgi:hypothetical protein